jgi:hypothetical protein
MRNAVCVCCSAEVESEAYRQSAVQKGLSWDETDEEWEDRQKENGIDFKK